MTQQDLGTLVLGWIGSYGSPVIFALLLAGALGLPLPCTLIVIASGAFVRQDVLDSYSTPLLGLIGAVGGDLTLYSVGYFANSALEKRFGHTAPWQKARLLFEQRGGIAIFLTRWLLTALAFPITLIAGSSRYRFSKFVLFSLTGETLWIAIYGGLGYAFGSQWELVNEFIGNFSGFIAGAAAAGMGLWLLLRSRKKAPAPVAEEDAPEAFIAAVSPIQEGG